MMPTRLHTASHSSMLQPPRGWANVGARGLGIEDACTLARRINAHSPDASTPTEAWQSQLLIPTCGWSAARPAPRPSRCE